MTAFDVTASRQALLSKIAALGFFNRVIEGEFVSPPVGQFNAAVIMAADAVAVVGSTLVSTIERHTLLVRLYASMPLAGETDGRVEASLADLLSRTLNALVEDYQFDAPTGLRHIDLLGQYGAPLAARTGYVTINQAVHRIADIEVPLIVDDASTFAA